MIFIGMFSALSACVATDQDVSQGELQEDQTQTSGTQSSSPEVSEPPESGSEYVRIKFGLKSRDDLPSAEDRKRCEDAGGRVQRAGLLGLYHCVQDFPDGGKVCRDRSECIGECRTDDSRAVGLPGTGTCQEVDVPFGCYAMVRDGMVDGGMLCVD